MASTKAWKHENSALRRAFRTFRASLWCSLLPGLVSFDVLAFVNRCRCQVWFCHVLPDVQNIAECLVII